VEIELARALILNGEEAKGKELVRHLIQSNHENNALIGQAKTMFAEIGKADEGRLLLDTAVQEVVNLNNQGVKLVQQGDLETARIYFESAVNKLPGNKIINANAAYAFMLYMKKIKEEPDLLKKTRDNLEQVYNLDPNYADLPRLITIYREFTKEPLPWLTSTL
jgi:Flp pilus assembly protein TadD